MLALGTASVKGVNWVITVPTEIDCKQTCHTTETLRLLMPHLLDHLFCLFTTFIVHYSLTFHLWIKILCWTAFFLYNCVTHLD